MKTISLMATLVLSSISYADNTGFAYDGNGNPTTYGGKTYVYGRWLTRDPIGFAGGINVYGYCGSGPVGNIDPSGKLVIGDYDFTLEGFNEAMRTIGDAFDNASKFGIGDDGTHDSQPGYAESKHLFELAEACLLLRGSLQESGYNVTFDRYRGSGGGGFNMRKNGDRIGGLDVHPWHAKGPKPRPLAPKWKWPHLHFPGSKGHWPWK